MDELNSLFSVFPNTMSVHLRENQLAMVKHGIPGNWVLESISDEILTYEIVTSYIDNINHFAANEENTFFEEKKDLYQVIQLNNYRIVITKPPFSDAIEITLVRPTLIKKLHEYSLDKRVKRRLINKAEGILIAGAPGHGKSTFGSALANFFADQQKIVKTIEKPRDLQVDDRITQFTILSDDVEKVGDLLLLMRPDYVIFDEIRKSVDFKLYGDMRLAGIGMIGVVHATQAIDAIQRFVNRIELGLIPSIIDTVIFIENGSIKEVLSLKMVVKTPRGFTDQSLARPVIEVNDFSTGEGMYEIFSFGEQVVVIPVISKRRKGKRFSARALVETIIRKYPEIENNMIDIQRKGKHAIVISLPNEKAEIINSDLSIINHLEEQSNAAVYIEPNNILTIPFQLFQNNKQLIFEINGQYANGQVDLMVGNQFIMRVGVNDIGQIILSRKKATTRRLERLMDKSGNELFIIQSL